MAVKIEKGGWVLIFLIGLALVGYGLHRYNIIDVQQMFGNKPSGRVAGGEANDTSKPLVLPVSSSESDAEVRVRVNIWVGCAGGLVANGGLDTVPDSIFGKKGVKVSFKIIRLDRRCVGAGHWQRRRNADHRRRIRQRLRPV